jgi:hypothetical protein
METRLLECHADYRRMARRRQKRVSRESAKEENTRIQCLSSARSANIHVRLRLRRERKIITFRAFAFFALSREPLL